MSDWKNVQYKNGKYRTNEGGSGSSTFAGLDDVNFSDLQDGQVPKYNATTEKWENANESGGGGTVTDVQVDGVSVVNQQGVAEIEMPTPPAPDYPVTDVKVNGASVVDANKEAQITSYKEVTLAEYQALPSSKLSDGVMYCIKDVGGANQFPPLIYSDEEREVGVWRDGKPLYEKVITFSTVVTVSTNWTDINIGIPVDMIVYASVYRTSDGFYNILKASQANNSGEISIKLESGYFDADAVFIRYTKSTDTPGSGTWTTDGTYAHHYSTSEKVIGTWIDGKPIYEKTVELSSQLVVSYNSWTDTDIDATNMLDLIDIRGMDNVDHSIYSFNGLIDSNKVKLWACRDRAAYIRKIILQYTKTTD